MNGAPRLDTGLFFLNDRFAPSDPAAGFDERADESMKIRVRDLEGGTVQATASANPRNMGGQAFLAILACHLPRTTATVDSPASTTVGRG